MYHIKIPSSQIPRFSGLPFFFVVPNTLVNAILEIV